MQQEITRIKVKTEKTATRCEVCHQSDLFDPKTETCLRCDQVEKALTTQPQVTRSLWSPRFALIERENQSSSQENLFYAMIGNLIGLPVALFLGNYVFAMTVFFLIILLTLCYLASRYDLRKILGSIISNCLTSSNNSNQITTLFDKYPEEDNFYRETPYNKPKITTLFGNNKKE